MKTDSLTKFAWMSIGAAVLTIVLKTIAYLLTGSVGLLSDALESLVNLVAAIIALAMLKIAELPPDENHAYGHSKAEYFSSVIEGILIIIAAGSIGFTAVDRIMHPHALEQISLGLIVSMVASLINLLVATALLKAGKKHNSITLEADAQHLMTDVWTSVGVIVGIALVGFTQLTILDPLIAIGVAINIVFTGYHLIKRSLLGFMDTALEQEDLQRIKTILNNHCTKDIQYHAFRSRQSGARKFLSFHIIVPGSWTVQQAHILSEKIEEDLRSAITKLTITTHIEPLEDKASYEDESIDRSAK